ncbi:MAG: histidine phosphatase family protein [Patescibacteria group bacterium]
MEIYLVRHGETGGNLARRHQSINTSLTAEGKRQITETANTLKQLKPTHLLTSSVLRSVESAQIIGLACNLVPQTELVLRELDRPDFLHGHFHKSIGSLFFYARWYFGLTNHHKHGGESYKNLRDRIGEAQSMLAKLPNDAKVVVVSHSVFINFFIAHACQKNRLSPWRAAHRFLKVLSIKNGSITHIVYRSDSLPDTCPWQVSK